MKTEMSLSRVRIMVAMALVPLGLTGQARAQSALEGSWTFVAEESADVKQEIQQGTAEAGFFVRRFGRGVLERSLQPMDTLHIAFGDGGVAITAPDGHALQTTIDGPAVEVRNAGGEMEEVATLWDGDALCRVFRGDKGTREWCYSTDAAGEVLRVAVEVRARMLPGPIRYTLTYRRADAAADYSISSAAGQRRRGRG